MHSSPTGAGLAQPIPTHHTTKLGLLHAIIHLVTHCGDNQMPHGATQAAGSEGFGRRETHCLHASCTGGHRAHTGEGSHQAPGSALAWGGHWLLLQPQ